MPEECPGLCCVRTCCDVGCSAPVLRVGRLGGVRVRSAGGHARRGRAGQARWISAGAGGRMAQRRALRHLGH
eukprot:510486-Prymnesium_polylepis.1